MVFDDDEWNAFYRLMEAARDLGHEAEVDALCVLLENDASPLEVFASLMGLIKKEAFSFNERAANEYNERMTELIKLSVINQ